jgi:hypothetical protein
MKKPNYILTAILIFSSCERKDKIIDIYSLREDSLLIQITDSLIMPDSAWRKYMLVPPPLFPEDYTKKELIKEQDSLLQVWDTAHIYLSFSDTLLLFSKVYDLEYRTDTLGYFKRTFENLDSSFYALFKQCINDTNLKERKLNFGIFKTRYNYRIIPDDSIQIITQRGFLVVEVNYLSRVAFNENFDKACIGQLSRCGGECGGGYLIFLEKINGRWRIVERHLLFVA